DPRTAAGLFRVGAQMVELEPGVLVDVEVDVDRVHRDHAGQHVAAGDQVAGGDFRVADAAVDRRAHVGEVQLQPGGGQRGGGRRQFSARALRGGGLAVGILLGD